MEEAPEDMGEAVEDMEEAGDASEWILDIQVMLGSVDNSIVKACSISRVSGKIRQAKEKAYRPQFVSIGPFYRTPGSDLQLMEETKWRYMRSLLKGRALGSMALVENCCKAIRKIDSVVRASYGDRIELEPEELARIMVIDGCFFLELLRRLYFNVTGDPAEEEIDPSLENIDDTILPVLTDLSLLENQIPFVVLTTLARELSQQGDGQENEEGDTTASEFPSPEELAESLFECKVDSSTTGVFHFLHFMYFSSIDPYGKKVKSKKARQELKRCATKLQAVGIRIKTTHTNNASIDNKTGTVASALRKFVDRFDFKIDFIPSNDGKPTLIIPPLHIKEGTEVKWRNLLAWEQSGLRGISYQFTSYAYFFKGLICSVHDIELLKDKKVLIVYDTEMRDEDLLIMFQNITTGAEQMDDRYTIMCEKLNRGTGNPARKCWIMWWHYCRLFLAWIRYVFKIWIRIFLKEYIPDPWKFIALVAATVLLVLTIVQTYYAARGH